MHVRANRGRMAVGSYGGWPFRCRCYNCDRDAILLGTTTIYFDIDIWQEKWKICHRQNVVEDDS